MACFDGLELGVLALGFFLVFKRFLENLVWFLEKDDSYD